MSNRAKSKSIVMMVTQAIAHQAVAISLAMGNMMGSTESKDLASQARQQQPMSFGPWRRVGRRQKVVRGAFGVPYNPGTRRRNKYRPTYDGPVRAAQRAAARSST